MVSLWQYQFRIIMLGDSTVGKSSLVKHYTEGIFLDIQTQTVGIDFYVQFVEVEPGVRVKLQFWDTAGQERFRSVTKSYYRSSAGGLLVFDVANRSSFEHIRDWHQEVTEHVQPYGIVLVLVGHKCDLMKERTVSWDEASRLASSLGMQYVETSAKDIINVEKPFEMVAKAIYEPMSRGETGFREGWEGVKCYVKQKEVKQALPPEEKCQC
ncbi:ras-related protein Rab-39B-like [Latimeria chalumnae]|uniref:RAB42, member RAS oncogene family n=1 Tax=Latimeria chalumnae TaxID=7897 RepID=H3AXM9_LATCH|nr:PREDICTED: ras-related protein Rab-39B-like [Latimeria chalumnae]|eukprot:XP_005993186.1 PREDICTED: ras-related protein Rab-39B-like [Latimeria chalumnae]